MNVKWSIGVTAALAGLFTAFVGIASVVSFAYRNAPLHVAVETAAALISLVAAQLAWGRFRRRLELGDLLLAASLSVLAATNLLFSAVPAIVDDQASGFATWAPAAGRLLGALLLAGAAIAPERVLRRPNHDARRIFAAVALVLAALAGAVALAGDSLPQAVAPTLSPEHTHPRIVGNPVVLANELVVMALYSVAAVGFARTAESRRDDFARWLAVAATLAAFSRLNFFLFPSLYSPYFYTGDVLRLAAFVAIAIGGALEMRRLRGELAASAVLAERQRIARDIHDGVAQDLAFVLQHARRLAAAPNAAPAVGMLVTAAERALDECRHAITALERTGDEPLSEALVLTAVETAGREGAEVETRVDGSVSVPAATQEALLRVTREAIINAIRHGRAATVRIELQRDPTLRLRITDDGDGFDVRRALTAPGRIGLRTMQARMDSVGGELVIDSCPGEGTRIEATLP